jgi:NAD(P)-dependent dehydrogenase (short-subunit alcohol dehydrogenase family)
MTAEGSAAGCCDRFCDRGVLVTGGGSGIGRAAAARFAAAGARVMVAGRREAPLRETASLIRGHGGTAVWAVADVTSDDDVKRMVAAAVTELGGLHVAVNAAGVPSWGGVADLEPAEWESVVGTNLTAVWHCMRHQIAHMRRSGGGAIVNVASRIGAHMRVPHQGAYAATKSAMTTLSRTAARECAADGIRVNVVSPGPTDTGMSVFPGESAGDRDARVAVEIPLRRMASPGEIAAAVMWLASPEASFVVGHDLVVDGGLTA